MKTTTTLATAVILFATSALAGAAPWGGYPSRDSGRYDRDDRAYGRDDGRVGHYHGPRMSLEARAQLRLRQLGFYRGPVDGDFGRGSRSALVRFQYRTGLRPTGWLDGRTIRALRL